MRRAHLPFDRAAFVHKQVEAKQRKAKKKMTIGAAAERAGTKRPEKKGAPKCGLTGPLMD